MWSYGPGQQGGWTYPQIAAAQAQQSKQKSSGLGDLIGALGGAFGGLASAFGEDRVGTTAPNTNGMEGIGTVAPEIEAMPSAPALTTAPSPSLAWETAATPTVSGESLGGHPYMAPSEIGPTGKPQMAPLPISTTGYGPPAPGDPFQYLQDDPMLVNKVKGGRAPLKPENIESVVLHDRGGSYNGKSPYHIEVLPNGQIIQSFSGNQKAPHAYKLNPRSLSVAYGGQVGATPTRAAQSSLQRVLEGLKTYNPSLRFEGHGEAFQRTRGTPFQASKDGRSLMEARWRRFF